MENYKSIHTGEQIDAAIAQVLAKNFPFSIVATANDVHLSSLENGQHIFIQDENKLYRYKNSTLVEDAINYILDLGWFGSEEQAYAEAAAYDDSTKEYIYKDKRILFAEFPIPEQPDVNKTEKVIILQNTSYHRTALFLFKDGKFYLRHLGWDMDGVYLNPTWIETLPSHLAWDDETHTLSLKQWGETINEELQIPLADGTKAGLMSKEDKVKLDGITQYTLPVATSSIRGGIKLGYKQTANNRAVVLSTEKAYVNIPNATTSQSGLMSNSDKVKLDTMTTMTWSVLPNCESVDLGLSVKWASYNVGATKPEEYGGFYAWGETEEKNEYSWSTYKHCNGSYNTLTKYCTDSSYGIVDNKTTLEPEDDVAHVKWGGAWRMPTLDEINELKNNCTWSWTTLNGVNGYRVTSKKNSNSIFLPAAGYFTENTLINRATYGSYCCSELSYYNRSIPRIYFSNKSISLYDGDRYQGYSIRPVCNLNS